MVAAKLFSGRKVQKEMRNKKQIRAGLSRKDALAIIIVFLGVRVKLKLKNGFFIIF